MKLAARLGLTEGQTYTLAIGLVLGLGTAAIGIPPTLRDHVTPVAQAAEAAPVASTPQVVSVAPVTPPSDPAPAYVAPATTPSFTASPAVADSFEPSGPAWADGGGLGDVEPVASTGGAPTGIAVDPGTGGFFVAVGDHVVRYDAAGAVARSYAVRGARLTGVSLQGDRLLAVDAATSRVLELDPSGGSVRTLGTVPELAPAGGRRAALQGVVATGDGTVYVADAGQAVVWRLAPGHAPEAWLQTPELLATDGAGPTGLAVDRDGSLLVTVGRSVVGLAGAVYRVPVDAAGKAGTPAEVFRAQPGTTLAGIAVGPSGRLYVASPSDGALLVVDGGAVVRSVPVKAPYGLAFRGRSVLVTGGGAVVRAATDEVA